MEDTKHPLTDSEVEATMVQIADGTLYETFQGKPIVLRPLTLAEMNRLSQIYSKEMTRLTMEGDLLNEAMVDAMVQKKARQLGVESKALDPRVQQTWFRKLYESIPEMFVGGGDTEEIMKKSSELADAMSDEDMATLGAVNAVLGLKAELMKNTVEVQARSIQLRWEIFFAAENEDGTRFWSNIDEMESLPDKDFEELVAKYQKHKRGGALDFLSKLSPTPSGSESGPTQDQMPEASSQALSQRGRRTRKH